jgi:peptidoglycan/LPS O-acetylase OafA/YrhL
MALTGTLARDSLAAPERLDRLDGLRGIAACLVAFAYHGQHLYADGAFAGTGALVDFMHRWGWAGVDLFFVLSGFIFAHVYRVEAGWNRRRLGDFAMARVARLWPLHLVMLLLAALLAPFNPVDTWPAFFANLLMLQGFVGDVGHDFNGPSWSISIEMACYAVFAGGAMLGPRPLRRISIAVILLAGWWLWMTGRPGGPFAFDVLPRGLLGFFVGQLAWHGRTWLARVPGTVLGLIAAAGVGVAAWASTHTPLVALDTLTWPALLLLGLRAPWLGSAPMRWLGDRSYAIYLIHYPLIEAFRLTVGPLPGTGLALVLGHAGLVVVVLMLADIALRWIEWPARDGVRRWWRAYFGRNAARCAITA